METIEHKTITANGINIHIAEKGQGPLVLFLHGFPGLWYSWRHQILYMAAHGYRAVAPDLRGYGDTTGAPVDDCTKFTSLHVVGDIVALLDAIAPDEHQVFVVGHDWGAFMAWSLCLYRPDRVKALVNLSVHFMPRDPVMKPIAMFRGLYGDDHYMCRFQVPGDIEAEFAQIGVRDVVKKFLTYRDPCTFYFPKGKGFGGFPDTPGILPSWLSEEDVDYYTSKFEKNGFTGGINYYRAFDLNWELAAPWTDAQVKVPTKKYVPRLEEVVIMEGVAHHLNQEKPQEIKPTHSRVHQQVLIFPSFRLYHRSMHVRLDSRC
ncbi:hypothetical protein RHMOL_Rhmol02G0008200 [Rhododendron molle]|uniref:Uncharacterized protein n=1 Tax=Rhododendron molle TaxID=49168 RepID=A0ACC0PLL8_RHOML|nr:hypothetical protein RHMOL_Rhmol02G0008200 [Rhododendron molle]